MIAFLRGILIEKGVEAVVLDVGGVGYAVTVTSNAERSLPVIGSEARLHIYTHAVQDGPMQLFGFANAEERRLFETLLSVQGVGPKVGIAIVSGMPVGDLVRAITNGDVSRLTQIRGIGRKIAERMAVELRDKIGAVTGGGREPGSGVLPGSAPSGRLGEVYGALVALGYKPVEFEALLPKMDATLNSADLVKQALAALRKR
jgi:Holliday junction DNA helicase RuvA